MKLLVNRFWPNVDALIGQLYIDGVVECFTLEPAYGRQPYPPVVAGVYSVNIRWSDKFGRDIPHIDNVPNRTAIEIHSGNTEIDTDGCLLVGVDRLSDSEIGDSRAAFSVLYAKLAATRDAITIEFVDVPLIRSADIDEQIGG